MQDPAQVEELGTCAADGQRVVVRDTGTQRIEFGGRLRDAADRRWGRATPRARPPRRRRRGHRRRTPSTDPPAGTTPLPARRGRGVASAALAAFLQVEPVRPLFARVAEHNVGSSRVLVRAGFLHVDSEVSPAAGVGREVVEHVYRLDA